MARWIETILRDEMVSCTIEADSQDRGRRLLAEFYDEKPGRGAK
jgi:hypothetical protein